MVLDASVWVSRFVAGDSLHSVTRAWFEGGHPESEGPILVPLIALAEVAGAVARRTRSSVAGADAMRLMLGNPSVFVAEMSLEDTERAAELAAILLLRGMDAIYVSLAQTAMVPLITWDDEIIQRAASVIQVQHPD